MSRIRIDPAAVQAAEEILQEAETEQVEAKEILTEIEARRDLIQWAHQQANHEHHSRTSASGLYLQAYGSSRRHMDKCNANMDKKEAIDRKYEENMNDVQQDLDWAGKKHDKAVKKVREAVEQLCRAKRGF